MFTFINSATPWSGDTARNALDMLMMAVSLDQDAQVIFTDDGVYQLLAQHAELLDTKNPLAKYRLLIDIFELEQIYVLQSALRERNLQPKQLHIQAKPISDAEFVELLSHSTKVVRF